MIKLEESEQIVYKTRKHWFVFVSESIFLILLALVPPALLIGIERINGFAFSNESIQTLWFLYSLWLILIWLVLIYIWTDYYLDIWLVTNHRVIDIDQMGLFSREISSFRLDMIQDATIQVPGILATLVGFGNINVQTAGQHEPFKMKGVAHPHRLKEAIVAEQNKLRHDMHNVEFNEPEI